MTTPRSTETAETSLARDLFYAARYYLAGRRGLLVLASLAIAAGVAMNWGWLAAAGIAPILISVLPCLAMCALGLCMNRAGSTSCATATNTDTAATANDAVVGKRIAASEMVSAPVAAELPGGPEATPLVTPDPQPSEERRSTDA